MGKEVGLGAILHHRNFMFKDGSEKNKYLVILGAKPNHDYLCVLTTTSQWIRKRQKGCHHKPRTYFFIPQNTANFFSKDTWLILSKPRILSRPKMLEKRTEKIIQVKGNLNDTLTADICKCLTDSEDLSGEHQQLI